MEKNHKGNLHEPNTNLVPTGKKEEKQGEGSERSKQKSTILFNLPDSYRNRKEQR
jgi:hypothetical protein